MQSDVIDLSCRSGWLLVVVVVVLAVVVVGRGGGAREWRRVEAGTRRMVGGEMGDGAGCVVIGSGGGAVFGVGRIGEELGILAASGVVGAGGRVGRGGGGCDKMVWLW